MAKIKPKVFIGSSSEAKALADAFSAVLSDVARTEVWYLSESFKTMQSTLHAILTAAEDYDFGLFLMTPDDAIESRGQQGRSARDNVLFEIGLFLGTLGPERTIIVMQDADDEKKKVKTPTDLTGINIHRFSLSSTSDNFSAVANNTAIAFKKYIRDLSRRQGRFGLRRGYAYDYEAKEFRMIVSAVKVNKHFSKIKGKGLVLAAFKRDDQIEPEDNLLIAKSLIRKVTQELSDNIILKVSDENIFSNIGHDDYVEGYLILCPLDVNAEECGTMSAMVDRGGEILDSVAVRLKLNSEQIEQKE